MHTKAFVLLRLLADAEFHSGEALSALLGVSRATVWNLVHELRDAGIEIFSVTGRGYKLARPVSMLGIERIAQALGHSARKLTLELVDQIESTNSALMRRAAEHPAAHALQGTCLIAEWQTRGRGRRGRAWLAGIGGGITFSLLWRFEQGALHLSALSLAVGVALVRALEELGIKQVKLKWPNDVIHHHHKLAGVLIELEGDVLGPSVASIGVGINARLSEALHADIDQAVTDLETLSGEFVDRNAALGCVLRHLVEVLETYAQEGFAPFKQAWLEHHAYHGREVWLQLPQGASQFAVGASQLAVGERQAGVVDGVADDGSLLLRTEQGQRRYTVGEISVRAIPSK
jgi:BirA family transcriptional regulator, biotin operon repressor / biotin---[acetyl-CoA-carboxylase] ligase